jgi:predicted amidohydrolase YtcJ
MIHAQALRRDQLPRVVAVGMIPSFFVAHTFYWGDWHRDSVFGPERAAAISPTASALANGVKFTIHNDAPVVPPNGVFLLWTATNRITRSGQVLGPEERLTAEQALRALTIDAAYQAFEENEKGSLEPGKLADLVILSANPMDVEPGAIRDIEVLETVKAGKTIWREDD